MADSAAQTIVSLADGIAVREWRPSDAAAMAHHANNKKIWANLRNGMPHPYTEANADWWIAFSRNTTHYIRSGAWSPEHGAQGPPTTPNYAITIGDEAVGSIALVFKDDVYFRTAELGYWLGEAHWGKGIMSRVVPPFVAWAWRTFGILVRISAETYEWNAASGRVLEKAGFEYEGLRRDVVCKDGRIGGEVMRGALRPK